MMKLAKKASSQTKTPHFAEIESLVVIHLDTLGLESSVSS